MSKKLLSILYRKKGLNYFIINTKIYMYTHTHTHTHTRTHARTHARTCYVEGL